MPSKTERKQLWDRRDDYYEPLAGMRDKTEGGPDPESVLINDEIRIFAKKWFRKWIKKGYSGRDLELMMHHAAGVVVWALLDSTTAEK